MRFDPTRLPAPLQAFLAERHLATLTTVRSDGRLHVVPVGFTWDGEDVVARVITSGTSQKVTNVRRAQTGAADTGTAADTAKGAGAPAVLCQVDGRRWITLEGTASVIEDAAAVAEAEDRYERRYRRPRPNPARVVIVVEVDRVLGSAPDPPPAAAISER